MLEDINQLYFDYSDIRYSYLLGNLVDLLLLDPESDDSYAPMLKFAISSEFSNSLGYLLFMRSCGTESDKNEFRSNALVGSLLQKYFTDDALLAIENLLNKYRSRIFEENLKSSLKTADLAVKTTDRATGVLGAQGNINLVPDPQLPEELDAQLPDAQLPEEPDAQLPEEPDPQLPEEPDPQLPEETDDFDPDDCYINEPVGDKYLGGSIDPQHPDTCFISSVCIEPCGKDIPIVIDSQDLELTTLFLVKRVQRALVDVPFEYVALGQSVMRWIDDKGQAVVSYYMSKVDKSSLDEYHSRLHTLLEAYFQLASSLKSSSNPDLDQEMDDFISKNFDLSGLASEEIQTAFIDFLQQNNAEYKKIKYENPSLVYCFQMIMRNKLGDCKVYSRFFVRVLRYFNIPCFLARSKTVFERNQFVTPGHEIVAFYDNQSSKFIFFDPVEFLVKKDDSLRCDGLSLSPFLSSSPSLSSSPFLSSSPSLSSSPDFSSLLRYMGSLYYTSNCFHPFTSVVPEKMTIRNFARDWVSPLSIQGPEFELLHLFAQYIEDCSSASSDNYKSKCIRLPRDLELFLMQRMFEGINSQNIFQRFMVFLDQFESYNEFYEYCIDAEMANLFSFVNILIALKAQKAQEKTIPVKECELPFPGSSFSYLMDVIYQSYGNLLKDDFYGLKDEDSDFLNTNLSIIYDYLLSCSTPSFVEQKLASLLKVDVVDLGLVDFQRELFEITQSEQEYPKVETKFRFSGENMRLEEPHINFSCLRSLPLGTRFDEFEFFQLREYRPGDDFRRVNWRASARSDKVIVNEFRPTELIAPAKVIVLIPFNYTQQMPLNLTDIVNYFKENAMRYGFNLAVYSHELGKSIVYDDLNSEAQYEGFVRQLSEVKSLSTIPYIHSRNSMTVCYMFYHSLGIFKDTMANYKELYCRQNHAYYLIKSK